VGKTPAFTVFKNEDTDVRRDHEASFVDGPNQVF
jgi:hypothetical protein